MRGSSLSGDARLWSLLLTVAPSFVLPSDAIICSVPTSISRVSPSSDVLFDSSIDAKGSFLAEDYIASIMTLDGRRLRGDCRSGTGLCCGLHWAATTAATIAVLELQYRCAPYILAVFSAVTLFYITTVRLKEDCGVHVSPHLRIHGRRTDLHSCRTSSLEH